MNVIKQVCHTVAVIEKSRVMNRDPHELFPNPQTKRPAIFKVDYTVKYE